MTQPTRLGELLVANGIISRGQLDEALSLQEQSGGLLGMILVNKNFITPDKLSDVLKMQG